MKKVICLFCIMLSLFMFAGCKQITRDTSAETLEHHVAHNLENINDIQNVSEETTKALSVIERTNLLNSGAKFADSSSVSYSEDHEKIYNISNQTAGEILINPGYSNNIEINETFSPEWETEIKKSTLLSFLNKNNISLSNISNIEPTLDDNGKLLYLSVGGKNIEYKQNNKHKKLSFFYNYSWRNSTVI